MTNGDGRIKFPSTNRRRVFEAIEREQAKRGNL
jgi:hypothetical protein